MVRKRGEFASVMLNNDWSKIKPVSCDNLIVPSETSGKKQNELDYYKLHPKHKNKNFLLQTILDWLYENFVYSKFSSSK